MKATRSSPRLGAITKARSTHTRPGVRYGIGLPAAADVAITSMPRVGRGHAIHQAAATTNVTSRLTAPPASSRPPLCRIGDVAVSRKAYLAPVPHAHRGACCGAVDQLATMIAPPV